MKSNFNKACKELYICFKNIDNTIYEKIPNEFLKVIIENMDSDYYFYYDENKKIYEQELLEETKNLIGYIYYNYWTNEQEKEVFKNVIIDKEVKCYGTKRS